MAELILFEHPDFKGKHKHVFRSEGFLSDFNDVTSSFVILAGQWEFFINANFEGETGGRSFGPGLYHWVAEVGVADNTISSVRLIEA